MKYALREYQVKDVDNIRAAFRQGFKAPLYNLPTSGGKTIVFCHIAEQAAAKGRRIYILVHRQELLKQASEKLSELNVPHGIIAPGRTMTGDLVQVASVDTLIRRLPIVPRPDIIIVDEAHHCIKGNKWGKVASYYNSFLLGVTATPCRTNGDGLGVHYQGYFDCIIPGPSIRDLIDEGWVSPPIIYAPPVGIDLSGVSIRAGDYAQNELEVRVDKAKITGDAVQHYLKICNGTPAIAFCVGIKHAENVAQQFNAAGVPSASIDGTMSDNIRSSRIADLGNGRLKVLTSCDIISEGTDIPIVTTAILLRPTYSLCLFLQQTGRALRVHPGKKHSIILDHVNNTSRHGLVDEVRTWTLAEAPDKDKRKKSMEGVERVRQCKQCFAVFPMNKEFCPQCGALWQGTPRELREVEGELKPLTVEEIEAIRQKRMARQEQGTSQTLEQLKQLALRRGYKPGWAEYVYRARLSKQRQLY